jgi:transcriptional regulator with XRE-family HTH domain
MMVNTKHDMDGQQTLSQGAGEEIRRRREPLAISQEELAHGAGLHRNVIGRLERGTYNPSVMTLLSIVAEFDIPLSELIISAERRMR